MLLLNKSNGIDALPEHIRKYAFNATGKVLPLTVGKRYVVCGLERTLGEDFALIIDDSGELKGHPWWHWLGLFDVIDNSKPTDWVVRKQEGHEIETFPELADNLKGNYYSSLQDGDDEAVSTFLRRYEQYARLHDLWYVDGKIA